MLPKRQQARYRSIIRQLSKLRERGFDRNTHPDVEILEAELDDLGERMTRSFKRPVMAELHAHA